MGRGDSLGDFEQRVLWAILRLGTNAYGVTIREYLEQATGKTVSVGAVYTTLDRMEVKGYVKSWLGEPTGERGGRAKKFFKVEAPGMKALAAAQAEIEAVRSGYGPAIAKPGFAT
jgi:PadR family transcriptional regulator, regulatory protein PadR